MRSLVIGDTQLDKPSIEELMLIHQEILTYQADNIIHLGDFFEKNRPSPKEIEIGAMITRQWVERFKSVIILSGNHDDLDDKTSSVDYLKYVGAKVYHTAMDFGPYFFGHFFVDKSPLPVNLQKEKLQSLEALEKDHKFVLLGHVHDFTKMSDKSYHLGSVRYCSFGEKDEPKRLAILENNKIEFKNINSTIPIKTVSDSKELEKIDPDTKVRLIVSSFADMKNVVSKINAWKSMFYQFKLKLDFTAESLPSIETPKERKSNGQIIKKWLEQVEDQEVREELVLEFEHYSLDF